MPDFGPALEPEPAESVVAALVEIEPDVGQELTRASVVAARP